MPHSIDAWCNVRNSSRVRMPAAVRPIDCPTTHHSGYQYIGEATDGAQLAVEVRTGAPVSVRLIPRREADVPALEEEFSVHRGLHHPHILQLKEVYLADDFFGIVTERPLGGTLRRLVLGFGPLPEKDARWYFQQILMAVDYCHKKNMSDLNLSLDTVHLTSSNCALLKLDKLQIPKAQAPARVPDYTPPELRDAEEPTDSKAADVWTLAVMLYVLVQGSYPFQGSLQSQQGDSTTSQLPGAGQVMPLRGEVSQPLRDLLALMFTADPAARITLDQIFAHPWVQVNMPSAVPEMNTYLVHTEGGPVTNDLLSSIPPGPY